MCRIKMGAIIRGGRYHIEAGTGINALYVVL